MRTEERTAYFLQQLMIGDRWAEFVAEQIQEVGKYAYATPTKIAESEADIKDFTENEKDILLSRDRTLEVKSRSFHFTSVDDYPYETAFVDTVEGGWLSVGTRWRLLWCRRLLVVLWWCLCLRRGCGLSGGCLILNGGLRWMCLSVLGVL